MCAMYALGYAAALCAHIIYMPMILLYNIIDLLWIQRVMLHTYNTLE